VSNPTSEARDTNRLKAAPNFTITGPVDPATTIPSFSRRSNFTQQYFKA